MVMKPSRLVKRDSEDPPTTAVVDERGLDLLGKSHAIYAVQGNGRQPLLAAGRAHGISKNARFTLYQSMEALRDGSKPWGHFIAQEEGISFFQTRLDLFGDDPGDFQAPCIAIQTGPGDLEVLRVHVPGDAPQISLFVKIASLSTWQGHNYPCRIELVNNKAEAHLEIVPAGDSKSQARFLVLDEVSTSCGFSHLPHVVDLHYGSFGRVLRSAARYFFQLNLHHLDNRLKEVEVKFFPLQGEYDDDGKSILTPRENSNMHREGMIEIEVEEETEYYGMCIRFCDHDVDIDLQLVCFYFDHANLSITSLTDVREYHRLQYHLKKGGDILELLVGYGNSVIPPLEFNQIPQGLDLTLGFLKFHFFHFPEHPDAAELLSTLTIPVVQKRKLTW